MNEPRLDIQVGFSSPQGHREDNQDFGGFTQPGGKDTALRGYVAAEDTLCTEAATLALEAHDRFLLCSDGLHASLRENDIRRLLLERMSPESTAQGLTQMALEKGSRDNITALVVDVISLPPPNRSLLQDAKAAFTR